MPAACAIISASMPSRPAVSTMTMSCMVRRACSIESRGHLDRVADAVAGLRGVDVDAGLAGHDRQLVDGVGALQVGGDEQRRVALALSQRPSLPASVVLPEPWRPASMITVGDCLANRSRRVSPPRMLDELLVDDLDDLLGRVQRLGDLGARGPAP